MNEPSGAVDEAPPMGGGMGDICVPMASLSEPDSTDQMVSPEVGDPVTVSVEGTISRVEGSNAYITPTAFNGQKVEKPQGDEESQLRDMAAGMGGRTY